MHRWLGRVDACPAPWRILLSALLVSGAGVLGAASCQAPSDWCSPIIVRPDQRFVEGSNCVPIWSEYQIATSGEVVLLGDFTDVAQPVIPAPGRTCDPSPSHAHNAGYIARLRMARALAGRPPLTIVHMSRFELVPAVLAATPGFHASHLLTTQTPWSSVTGFFRLDTSPDCLPDGCEWSDSWGGRGSNDPGHRIRDYIDADAGFGNYQTRVYYLARPSTEPVYWPTAVIADLRNPDYRAWRVAEARRAIAAGGYDMVDLSQKLQQFRTGDRWIGGYLAYDVTALNAMHDTFWSARPDGYSYAQYVSGWHALALELHAAGVPFAVSLPHQIWTGSKYDDSSTPSVDEAALLRDAAEWAALVMVDVSTTYTDASWQALAQDIGSRGARVVRFDQSCPLAGD